MFRFTQPITMGNASASLADCIRAIDAGEQDVALDALAHSDSSAVAVLLSAERYAGSKGRSVRWTGMPAAVASLARLYGVDDLLGVARSG